MDNVIVNKYIALFDEYWGLNAKQSSRLIYELNEPSLRQCQQELADLLFTREQREHDLYICGAMVFPGYRLGASILKGKAECFSRQDGYKDNAIWKYNANDLLEMKYDDGETDADSQMSEDMIQFAGTINILEWLINPQSNIEIADAVMGKMHCPIVKKLGKIIPPGKSSKMILSTFPVSPMIGEIDWEKVLSNIHVDETVIEIKDMGELLSIAANERKYLCFHVGNEDTAKEYFVVSAYEVERGQNVWQGSLAYDMSDEDEVYELCPMAETSITISSNQNPDRYKKRDDMQESVGFEYPKKKLEAGDGVISFLSNHSASFMQTLYKKKDVVDVVNRVASIKKTFSGSEALDVSQVCSRALSEQNLYKLAISDVVYIANLLEKSPAFVDVTVKTGKQHKLGTTKNIDSFIDLNKVDSVPSNYASFGWKLKPTKRGKTVPYHSISPEKNTIREIVEAIVDYFSPCTTEDVANEYLYLFDPKVDPSAFFIAKMFLYLASLDSISIESRNDYVQDAKNVDEEVFVEISKPEKHVANIPIEDLRLSVRSYNCLKRAGINTVFDLSKKTRNDLYKVRNMGTTNVQEILAALKSIGVALK